MAATQFHAQAGVLIEAVAERPGAVEWRVRLHDGEEARAIAFNAFSGDLSPGQPVWLNTTAAELELGTGGLHFILAPRGDGTEAGGPTEIGARPRRSAGHLMKLRYTPLQHAVQAVEEVESPHRAAVEAVQDLSGWSAAIVPGVPEGQPNVAQAFMPGTQERVTPSPVGTADGSQSLLTTQLS